VRRELLEGISSQPLALKLVIVRLNRTNSAS
jgi:hypothetical protein